MPLRHAGDARRDEPWVFAVQTQPRPNGFEQQGIGLQPRAVAGDRWCAAL